MHFCQECVPYLRVVRVAEGKVRRRELGFIPPYRERPCLRCGKKKVCTIMTAARVGGGRVVWNKIGSVFREKDISLELYQDAALQTAIYPDIGDNVRYPALGLAGEIGEICNKIKKIERDQEGVVTQDTIDSLAAELGDVLWYVAALCSELGLRMAMVAIDNLEKLADRQTAGTLQGSGDKR